MRDILKGATDQSTVVRIVDSADGTPEEAVDTGSPSPTLWYRRELGAKTTFNPATLAALTTAHTDGGFKHISDGYYRVDVPDAAFATGADGVLIGGTSSGMVVIGAYHKLVEFDLSSTAAGNQRQGALGVVRSTCAAGSTTTVIQTNLTEATNDHYNGATLTFVGGALDGQRTSISDYDGSTKALTVVALTEAPANTDPFVIT